jgi:hypothetical protein
MDTKQTQETQTSLVEAAASNVQLPDVKEASTPAGQDGSDQRAGSLPDVSTTAEGSSRGNRLLSYLDAATMLALATAVLYAWGYAYFSAYFASLRLPYGLLTLPFEAYVLTGWNYGWAIIFFGAVVLFLRALFSDSTRWLLNKIPLEHKRALSGYVSPFAISMALVIFIYIGYTARQDARNDAAAAFARHKRVEFVTAEGITLPKPLYLLGYTGSKYVVYYQPDEKTEPKVFLLGENEVRSPAFPGGDDRGTSASNDTGTQEKSVKEGP